MPENNDDIVDVDPDTEDPAIDLVVDTNVTEPEPEEPTQKIPVESADDLSEDLLLPDESSSVDDHSDSGCAVNSAGMTI